jgi:hypothetical protein
MAEEHGELAATENDEGAQPERHVVNRRRALALGAAAAGAWVVPEILMASPRAAALSGPTETSSHKSAGQSGNLAFTGDDTKSEVLVGAALIGAGWALTHWAARGSKTWPTR